MSRWLAGLAVLVVLHSWAPPAGAQMTTSSSYAPVAPPPSGPAAPAARVGGYIQVRETFIEPTNFTFTLNRARFSIDGALPNRFAYRALVELESGATARVPGVVSLREAIIRWSWNWWAAQAGQFKTPFSREFLIPVPALETPDFSAVVDSLAPKYDVGALAEFGAPFLGVAIGVFNGEGQNLGLNRDSTVLFIGRVSVRPIPEVTLAGNMARNANPDSIRYGADVSIERRGLFTRAEFIGQSKRGRARDDLGWYVLATARLLPLLQLLGKQEDFQRPSIGLARRVSATTAGLNVELPGGRTRVLLTSVWRTTGYPRVRHVSQIAQIQVRF